MGFLESIKELPNWLIGILGIILGAVSNYLFMGIRKNREARTDTKVAEITLISQPEKNLKAIQEFGKVIDQHNLVDILKQVVPTSQMPKILFSPHETFGSNLSEILALVPTFINPQNNKEFSPIDDDWFILWAESAKCYSKKEAQKIWAKILAQKLSDTNNVPKRIIRFISECESHELRLIENFFQKLIYSVYPDGKGCVEYLPIGENEPNHNELEILVELGILEKGAFRLDYRGVSEVYYHKKITLNVNNVMGSIVDYRITILASSLFMIITDNPITSWEKAETQ